MTYNNNNNNNNSNNNNNNNNTQDYNLPGKLDLSVVLYGCETWSPTLREEHRLEVYENRVLRRKFGPKRDEGGRNCMTRSFVICTLRQV
jgi:hypothetical protein